MGLGGQLWVWGGQLWVWGGQLTAWGGGNYGSGVAVMGLGGQLWVWGGEGSSPLRPPPPISSCSSCSRWRRGGSRAARGGARAHSPPTEPHASY